MGRTKSERDSGKENNERELKRKEANESEEGKCDRNKRILARSGQSENRGDKERP